MKQLLTSRTLQAWMHHESGIIIEKSGLFGPEEWLKSLFWNIKDDFFNTIEWILKVEGVIYYSR